VSNELKVEGMLVIKIKNKKQNKYKNPTRMETTTIMESFHFSRNGGVLFTFPGLQYLTGKLRCLIGLLFYYARVGMVG
jgi:hypothetical protein